MILSIYQNYLSWYYWLFMSSNFFRNTSKYFIFLSYYYQYALAEYWQSLSCNWRSFLCVWQNIFVIKWVGKVYAYLCVRGPLKFQFIITTVTSILTVFMMNVKRRYLAMSGNTNDVGGRIFETSNRNTTSDSKILIPKVTWKTKHIIRTEKWSLDLFKNKLRVKFLLSNSAILPLKEIEQSDKLLCCELDNKRTNNSQTRWFMHTFTNLFACLCWQVKH